MTELWSMTVDGMCVCVCVRKLLNWFLRVSESNLKLFDHGANGCDGNEINAFSGVILWSYRLANNSPNANWRNGHLTMHFQMERVLLLRKIGHKTLGIESDYFFFDRDAADSHVTTKALNACGERVQWHIRVIDWDYQHIQICKLFTKMKKKEGMKNNGCTIICHTEHCEFECADIHSTWHGFQMMSVRVIHQAKYEMQRSQRQTSAHTPTPTKSHTCQMMLASQFYVRRGILAYHDSGGIVAVELAMW